MYPYGGAGTHYPIVSASRRGDLRLLHRGEPTSRAAELNRRRLPRSPRHHRTATR